MSEHIFRWRGRHPDTANPDAADAREATGGGGGDGTPPVCIGEVDGPLRAEIARSYLESAGITVYLQSEAVASVYGLISGPLSTVRVLVPASQAEEAIRIFADLDFGSPGTPLDEE